MKTDVKANEILLEIDNMIIENEHRLLKYVARQFISIKQGDSLDDIRTKLLKYESSGAAGFDCGWSWLFINDHEIEEELEKQYKKLDKNLNSDYVAIVPKKITFNGGYALQVFLPNYPINVQSTKMKNCLLEQVGKYFEQFGIDSFVESELD